MRINPTKFITEKQGIAIF